MHTVYYAKYYSTLLSRYYDVCYIEMLLITIPNLSSKHYQIIEIYTGYIDSLDIY